SWSIACGISFAARSSCGSCSTAMAGGRYAVTHLPLTNCGLTPLSPRSGVLHGTMVRPRCSRVRSACITAMRQHLRRLSRQGRLTMARVHAPDENGDEEAARRRPSPAMAHPAQVIARMARPDASIYASSGDDAISPFLLTEEAPSPPSPGQ